MGCKELQFYQNYANFVKRSLLLGGIWPKRGGTLFYRQLPIIIALISSTMFYGIWRFCRENMDDLNAFTKGLSYLGTSLVVIVKVIVFFIYREQLHELNSTLEPMFDEILEDSRLRPVALSLLDYFRKPAYMIYYLTTSLMILYIFRPLVVIVYELLKGVHPKRYSLPFSVNFPYSDEGPGLVYQLQFVLEILFAWFTLFTTVGADSSYGLYIFQMVGILRAASFECETCVKSSEVLSNLLSSCAKKQTKLLRCRSIIQTAYGPIVFTLMLTSAVILCALIFQLLQTEVNVERTVLFLLYASVKGMQAFMYSWYGTIVIDEAEIFRNRIYSSKWYEFGELSLNKNIQVVLMQKPMTLTACKFFDISLDIFVKILNTSVSYYFLLKTVDESNIE